MNNPLNTIFTNKTKLKPLLEKQIGTFPNNKINIIHTQYQKVFSRMMTIFNESIFYNEVFLPRMNKRTSFMRMNRKFTPLTSEKFEKQKEILKINNTYENYSFRQEIPLFKYITEASDQFENWSAIRIFEWWRDLRMSRIPKPEWPVFDAVKYLFINQFMRIMNSYLKYGVDKINKLAFRQLEKYLDNVDIFYKSGGQYQYLLDVQLSFCEWFSDRFIGGLLFEMYNKKGNTRYTSTNRIIYYSYISIKYIFEITLLNENGILIIPLSFFQSENKFINLYSAPIIPLLGINYRTHAHRNFVYLPFAQIDHDIRFHSKYLFIYYLYTIYDYNFFTETNKFKPMNEILKMEKQNNKSIIQNIISTKKTYTNNYEIINNLFEQRCKFLTLLSSIRNDEPKKLLWFILHEIFFFDKISVEYPLLYFFDINIILNTLIEVLVVENNEIKSNYSIDSIYILICTCIVFLMCNFLELNDIQKINITVDNSITTVFFDSIRLFELKIITETKQIVLLYKKPDIDKKYIEYLKAILEFIIISPNLYQNNIKIYTNRIRQIMNQSQLQQAQP